MKTGAVFMNKVVFPSKVRAIFVEREAMLVETGAILVETGPELLKTRTFSAKTRAVLSQNFRFVNFRSTQTLTDRPRPSISPIFDHRVLKADSGPDTTILHD